MELAQHASSFVKAYEVEIWEQVLFIDLGREKQDGDGAQSIMEAEVGVLPQRERERKRQRKS